MARVRLVPDDELEPHTLTQVQAIEAVVESGDLFVPPPPEPTEDASAGGAA